MALGTSKLDGVTRTYESIEQGVHDNQVVIPELRARVKDLGKQFPRDLNNYLLEFEDIEVAEVIDRVFAEYEQALELLLDDYDAIENDFNEQLEALERIENGLSELEFDQAELREKEVFLNKIAALKKKIQQALEPFEDINLELMQVYQTIKELQARFQKTLADALVGIDKSDSK